MLVTPGTTVTSQMADIFVIESFATAYAVPASTPVTAPSLIVIAQLPSAYEEYTMLANDTFRG